MKTNWFWDLFSRDPSEQKKILVGLLKLPENRECADCKRRYPRWGSVNLGIFICVDCACIHQDLGETINLYKVRSAVMAIWHPDEVAFIQKKGNKLANSYWEAELPPNYKRKVDMNFIRDKYEYKIWAPKGNKHRSSGVQEVSNEQTDGHAIDEDSFATYLADFMEAFTFETDAPPPPPILFLMYVVGFLLLACIFLEFLYGDSTVTSTYPTFLPPT